MQNDSTNLLVYLQKHANDYPQKTACLFLADGVTETSQISYLELDRKVRAAAAYLQQHDLHKGQRVILLYPSGIEFIIAYLACLYAGIVAIPVAYPTKLNLDAAFATLKAVQAHASAAKILTTQDFTTLYANELPATFANAVVELIVTTNVASDLASKFQTVSLNNHDIAFLQYTSGTATHPKGVIITHGNLMSNLQGTAATWHYTADSISLNWAAHTHVYGLVTGLLNPLLAGGLSIIMPTMAFMLNPVRWLQAISKYRVTHSGCPNFAYDYCVSQIKDEHLASVDLSSWQVAINGGEFVQAATLRKFYNKFAAYGFRFASFCPAYGMSEMTGLIAAKPINKLLEFYEYVSENNYQVVNENEIKPEKRILVSCGQPLSGIKVAVINPETLIIEPENTVGEICLSGPTCMQDYWQHTANTSDYHISLTGNTGQNELYLKTGDLGFTRNNELIITGRLKDVIIINGKNYYAAELENTLINAEIGLQHTIVAFSLNTSLPEKLFIICEIAPDTTANYQMIIMAIRHLITKIYAIDVHGIILVAIDTIKKTGSGKKQRQLCKQDYLDQKFTILYQDIKPTQA